MGGVWHKASVSDCLPLAALIGLSPLLTLTLCGSERVLVVSTEPPDDLSWLTTPGVGCPRDGAVARAVDPGGGGGGGGALASPDPPTPPAPQHQKNCPPANMKFIKGAGNLRPIVGTRTFCWASDPPPPPHATGGGVFSSGNSVARVQGCGMTASLPKAPLMGPTRKRTPHNSLTSTGPAATARSDGLLGGSCAPCGRTSDAVCTDVCSRTVPRALLGRMVRNTKRKHSTRSLKIRSLLNVRGQLVDGGAEWHGFDGRGIHRSAVRRAAWGASVPDARCLSGSGCPSRIHPNGNKNALPDHLPPVHFPKERDRVLRPERPALGPKSGPKRPFQGLDRVYPWLLDAHIAFTSPMVMDEGPYRREASNRPDAPVIGPTPPPLSRKTTFEEMFARGGWCARGRPGFRFRGGGSIEPSGWTPPSP